jgi:hypothetical protein
MNSLICRGVPELIGFTEEEKEFFYNSTNFTYQSLKPEYRVFLKKEGEFIRLLYLNVLTNQIYCNSFVGTFYPEELLDAKQINNFIYRTCSTHRTFDYNLTSIDDRLCTTNRFIIENLSFNGYNLTFEEVENYLVQHENFYVEIMSIARQLGLYFNLSKIRGYVTYSHLLLISKEDYVLAAIPVSMASTFELLAFSEAMKVIRLYIAFYNRIPMNPN